MVRTAIADPALFAMRAGSGASQITAWVSTKIKRAITSPVIEPVPLKDPKISLEAVSTDLRVLGGNRV
jgi:hypothetical protein